MIKPTLTDLNQTKFIHYPFMISLDKCKGSYIAVDDLSTKICLLSETKVVNAKVFNMTKKKINEAKTLVKDISCNCKCKFVEELKPSLHLHFKNNTFHFG